MRNAPEDCGDDVGEVEQRESECGGALGGVLAPAQPCDIDAVAFGARAQPHVGDAHGGNPDVVAERVGFYTGFGEGGEAVVEWLIYIVFHVVGADKLGGLGALGFGVEGAGRQVAHIDGLGADLPEDGAGGLEVDGPGAEPAVEAEIDALAGVVDMARSERLEGMEGDGVADGPGDERDAGEQDEEAGGCGGRR